MARDEITFWKCPQCHGCGEVAPHWSNTVHVCPACDGTGNALVDGAEREQRREIVRRKQFQSNT